MNLTYLTSSIYLKTATEKERYMTLKQLFPKSLYPLRARTKVQIEFDGKKLMVIQEVYYQTPILAESDRYLLLNQKCGLHRIIQEGKERHLTFAAVATANKFRFYTTINSRQFVETSDIILSAVMERHAKLIGHLNIGLPLSGEIMTHAHWKSF